MVSPKTKSLGGEYARINDLEMLLKQKEEQFKIELSLKDKEIEFLKKENIRLKGICAA